MPCVCPLRRETVGHCRAPQSSTLLSAVTMSLPTPFTLVFLTCLVSALGAQVQVVVGGRNTPARPAVIQYSYDGVNFQVSDFEIRSASIAQTGVIEVGFSPERNQWVAALFGFLPTNESVAFSYDGITWSTGTGSAGFLSSCDSVR